MTGLNAMKSRMRANGWSLSLSCSAIALAVGAPARAADNETAKADSSPVVEEIIVTAQKRSENLQNVPIAVAAFNASMLKAANILGAVDLVSVTPSLRFQYGGPGGTVFLRGVGNSQQFAGAESEVQTYVDGVYYGSAGAAFLRFNNIEGIEVDKGPQGTLFGRNATGGVIQIKTRDPADKPRFDGSIGYGKYDAVEGDAYAGGGVSSNIRADVAIHYENRGGWGKNLFNGQDAFSAKSFGIRSKWIFEPSSSFRATLALDYGRDKSDLGSVYVLQSAPVRFSLAAPIPVIPPPYTLNEDTPGSTTVTAYGASLKLETDVGSAKFVSITAGRKTKSHGILDADGTTVPFAIGDETRNEFQASQEFQLLSAPSSRLKWILGTFFYYNKSKADPATLSGLLISQGLLGSVGGLAVKSESFVDTKSAAVFGQATFDVTPTTHITGGLRFTYDDRGQDARNTALGANGPVPFPPFLGFLNQNQYPSANFKALTGKFTIAQDIDNNAMVYATYSRGYKAGTFNNFQVLSNPAPALSPEYIDSFEGGLKSELLDKRVRLNLAGFYYKYSNLQVNEFVQVPVPTIALLNAASADIKGIEGDVRIVLAKNTRLSGSFGYLDARYKSFPSAPTYIVVPIDVQNSGVYGGIQNGSINAAGKHMPQAPEFSGNINLMQGFDIGSNRLDLSGTVSYQSRVYFTPDNLYGERPTTLLSASAKWTGPDGKWDVTIWGRNLTNRKTISQVVISSIRGVAGIPNEPVAFGARLSIHF